MDPLFYEGDLQSGIGLALRESKSVACFIRDDGEESSLWETEYLGDTQVRAALVARTIALRIQAGSQEAGFLTAYYPVPAIPALMIIHNGHLILDLRSGQDKAAFKSSVLTKLISTYTQFSTAPPDTPQAATPSTAEAASTLLPDQDQSTRPLQNAIIASPPDLSSRQATIDLRATETTATTSNPAAQQHTPTDSAPSSSSQQSVVQRLLEERRRKLEADKKEKEAAEKADRKAKADARKESMTAAPSSAKAKQANYAQEQRKRDAEAKLERERILRQIEQDKADRKEKEERRRALARSEAAGDAGQNSTSTGSHGNGHKNGLAAAKVDSKPEAVKSGDCAVQVRMFDGSTIRNKFKIEQTLNDIRKWIQEERCDDEPFSFKQILSPLPNRSLTISEEKENLIQLGFVPSTTLVMVPIKGYTSAYTDAGPGAISRVVSLPYNTVVAGAGMVSGALGTFLGFGQAVPRVADSFNQAPTPARSETQPSTSESGINIRTLRDKQEKRDDHQLYNGNSMNVEPRDDEREKDE